MARRRRLLWRSLVAIGLCVPLGAVVAVACWLALLDTAALKSRVEALASHALHRDVRVNGDLSVSLLPTPSLIAYGLRVGAIAAADSIRARLALAPLLRGQVVLSEMTLERPVLHLPPASTAPQHASDATPTQHASDATAAQHASDATPTQHASDATPVARHSRARIEFRRIDIDDGAVILSDGTTLSGIDAQLSQRDGTLTLTAQGHLPADAAGKPGALLAIQGTLDPADQNGGHVLATLSAPGLSVGLDGALAIADRRYDGAVSVTAPDLANAAALLSHYMTVPPLPPVHDLVLTARAAGPWRHPTLSALHVVVGSATLDGFAPSLSVSGGAIDGDTLDGPFKAHVVGTLAGAPLAIDATLDALPGAAPAAVMVQAALAGAAAGGATLEGRGTIGWPLDRSPLALSVDAKADDLASLGALFGRGLPAGPASLSGRLDVAHDPRVAWSVSDLAIASPFGALVGMVGHTATPRPLWQAEVTARDIDLDAVLAAMHAASIRAGTTPGPGAPSAPSVTTQPRRERVIADMALPGAWLRDNDAKLDVNGSHLRLHGQSVDVLRLHATLAAGKLDIDPAAAEGPAGSATVRGAIDAAVEPMTTRITVQVPKASLGALLAGAGLPGDSEGVVTLDADLAGAGDGTRALAATLSGGFTLDAGPGRIDNRAVEALFGRALQAASLPVSLSGSSDLRCLLVAGSLKDGRGDLTRLALDTTRLALDGNGAFDLGRETLDLHLRPLLRIGHSGAAIPVHVVGSFADPKTSLDASGPDGRVSLVLGALAGAVEAPSPCNATPKPAQDVAVPAPAKAKPPKAMDILRGLLGR